MNKTLLALVLLMSCGIVQAQSRYVTDQFQITLRSGESSGHKILRMLPSGEKLTLLSSNSENGYSKVRAADGKVGFVLTRQLMDGPSARDRLTKAEQRLKELQEEPGRLSSKLARLQDEFEKLQGKYNSLSEQKQKLDKELEGIRRTASNAIRISNERNDLRKMVAQQTHQVENLKQENRELRNETNQRWFLIGGGVIIIGIILGLILPHLRFQRRKSSWGSL